MAKHAREKLLAASREGLRRSVVAAANEIELPLREATQMLRVLSLIEGPRTEDGAAIGFVAAEAARRLYEVNEVLLCLSEVCAADA